MSRRNKTATWGQWVLVAVLVGIGLLIATRPKTARNVGGILDPGSSLASSFLAHKERWGAKTGVGGEADSIDLAHPVKATVAELTALDRPEGLPDHGGPGAERFGEVEHTEYTIDAKLLRYKLEADDDQDFHIVITDYQHPGPTMIVEIPDPEAVGSSSPWRDSILNSREEFESEFHPVSRFKKASAHLRITGIGFFDFIHGQSGVAPNGIELHPVTAVELLDR